MPREAILARMQELMGLAGTRALTEDESAEYKNLMAQLRELDAASAVTAVQSEPQSQERTLDVKEAAERAIASERMRVREIEAMCSEWGIESRELIANGTSVDEARGIVMKQVQESRAPIAQRASVTMDEADRFRNAAADAICMRGGIQIEKPAEGAAELRHMTLKDLAIRCLANDGVASLRDLTEADPFEIFTECMRTWKPQSKSRAFMQPTGQFPAMLDQAIEKNLVDWYKKPDYQFEKIVKVGSLPDFKPHDNNYASGPVGDFQVLPEGGEMKEDSFELVKLGQRKIETYAKRFSMSYQAFVNDDIGILAEQPRKYARAWRRTLNNIVFGLLINNAALGDGAKFFSAAHKNLLGQGTGITIDAISSMKRMLQQQTDDFGESIQIQPKTLIVPTGMDIDMYTLFNSPTINTTDNTQAANPMYHIGYEIVEDNTLNVLAEKAGLTAVPWFLAGDSADAPGIEVDYLNGQSQLQKRMGQPMDQLGFVWNFWSFAGVTVVDYRRYIKNPGIAITQKIPAATN